MRIFLTGASGFIGAHVTRSLLNKGHSVAALVTPDDSLWRLQDVTEKLNIVRGYINNLELLKRALKKLRPETCIHLAWYTEPGKYLHSSENLSCLSDSLSLLHELINIKCRHIIFTGTSAEYDSRFGYMLETTPTRPTTLYAASKLSCYLLASQIASAENINFTWMRIFNPYGPQEDERRLTTAAICSLQQGRSFQATLGEQVRDYIHVEDIADAFCLLTEEQIPGVYNISSGVPVTIRHLLETIGKLTGRTDLIQFGAQPYRDWDPPFICGNNMKLNELGWKPRVTLNEGLLKTITWLKEHI